VTPEVLILCIATLTCTLGVLTFAGATWMIPVYTTAAYATLLFVLVTVVRTWGDWLNPLLLICLGGFIRFGIPGLLLMLGVEPDLPLFQLIGLTNDNWLWGHLLALMGLTGVVFGWFFPIKPFSTQIHRFLERRKSNSWLGVPYACLIGMGIGFAALLMFVAGNASIVEVILSGQFRGLEITVGTGKYFHLSFLLIAGSVVFSAYLARAQRPWMIVLIPVVIAMLMFWVLGGRARSLSPVAAGLLLLWYRRESHRISWRAGVTGILLTPLLVTFMYVSNQYRGGGGLQAISETLSLTAVWEYLQWAVWVDIGQLHSLAGAVAIGPSVLAGRTFIVWPLAKFLPIPEGRSAGKFMADALTDFSDVTWGFHATLIGDAYLNFGLFGVFLCTALFGVIGKVVYTEFRRGTIDPVYYVLGLVYATRIFFESIEKLPELMIVLVFAFLVVRLGQTVLTVAPASRQRQPTFGWQAAGRRE
jgi:oligosaccharide repeat unit polymerase